MIKNHPRDAIITNTENCEKQKEKLCSGIVIENQWSRGSFLSVFKDKTVFKWRCKSKVRDIIEVGDSIYKPAGTFDAYIYKKANPDSVIFIECDFDCGYWEKGMEKNKILLHFEIIETYGMIFRWEKRSCKLIYDK